MPIPKAWLIGMIEELDEHLELCLKIYKAVKNKPIPAPLEEEKKKAIAFLEEQRRKDYGEKK